MNNESFQELWQSKCKQFDNLGLSLPSVLPAVNRIIVLGDIHGDMEVLKKSLMLSKLINDKDEWIGDDTVVVQVGDQIDRCRYAGTDCSLKQATDNDEGNDWNILKYMTDLHAKATDKGGAVYSLVGNHELMNVQGDMRYVSYEGFKEFDDWKPHEKYEMPENIKNKRKWAFAPGNHVADFLACTRQMALIIGSNLFVHAGILPYIAKKYSVEDLNKLLSLYLWDMLDENTKKEHKDLWSGKKSPLWIRDYGNMGIAKEKSENYKENKCKIFDDMKDIYKIDRIYIGHTPLMKNGISSVCNEKIWLTDYGASKAFDKFNQKYSTSSRSPQVLEILNDGDKITVLKE